MTGQRKGIVGPGYMPKGGAAAASRHNAEQRPKSDPSPPRLDVDPPQADVRASARSPWWYGFAVGSVGTAAASVAGCYVWLR